MKKTYIAIVIAAALAIWPGIPLATFYGPFVVAYFVHDGGR